MIGKICTPESIEDKILEYISDGLSSAEIAEKLSVGRRTIDTHRSEIMQKFELKNTLALIRFAFLYTESKRNSTNPYPLIHN